MLYRHDFVEVASNAELVNRLAAVLRTRRRGRPSAIDNEHLREVAAAYETTGGSQAGVARYFNIAERTAGDWIRRARDEGLIPETSRKNRRRVD